MLKLHQNLFFIFNVFTFAHSNDQIWFFKSQKTIFGAKLALKFSYANNIPIFFSSIFAKF